MAKRMQMYAKTAALLIAHDDRLALSYAVHDQRGGAGASNGGRGE